MDHTAWISGLLVVSLTAIGCGDGADGGGATATPSVKIAFTSFREGNLDVYVMNADGTNQVRLTNNAADDAQPEFGGR